MAGNHGLEIPVGNQVAVQVEPVDRRHLDCRVEACCEDSLRKSANSARALALPRLASSSVRSKAAASDCPSRFSRTNIPSSTLIVSLRVPHASAHSATGISRCSRPFHVYRDRTEPEPGATVLREAQRFRHSTAKSAFPRIRRSTSSGVSAGPELGHRQVQRFVQSGCCRQTGFSRIHHSSAISWATQRAAKYSWK